MDSVISTARWTTDDGLHVEMTLNLDTFQGETVNYKAEIVRFTVREISEMTEAGMEEHDITLDEVRASSEVRAKVVSIMKNSSLGHVRVEGSQVTIFCDAVDETAPFFWFFGTMRE